MSKSRNTNQIKAILLEAGFNDVTVLSDLHAAGKACYNTNAGYTIIAGTGSVLFHYDNGEVGNIVGGKGHEIGDEGSGFYFGKLIVDRFLSNGLNSTQLKIVQNLPGFHELTSLDSGKAKFHWANLSFQLSRYVDEFKEIHRENICIFLSKYLDIKGDKTICLVGSYTWYQRELWKEELSRYHVTVDKVVRQPIVVLVEQKVLKSE